MTESSRQYGPPRYMKRFAYNKRWHWFSEEEKSKGYKTIPISAKVEHRISFRTGKTTRYEKGE